MRFSDPTIVNHAVFARLASEAAGAAARALLGAGAASVLTSDALERGTSGLPARPLAVLASGPVPTNGGIDQHTGAWWLYDDPSQGLARLDALAKAICDAYDIERGAPALTAGRLLLGDLSEPRLDTALGLRARRLSYTVHH